MSSEPADGIGGNGSEGSFTLDDGNTFSFMPGPMTGVTCPACFRDQLLKEVIARGECRSCGAQLELTLSVRE